MERFAPLPIYDPIPFVDRNNQGEFVSALQRNAEAQN